MVGELNVAGVEAVGVVVVVVVVAVVMVVAVVWGIGCCLRRVGLEDLVAEEQQPRFSQ